MLFLGNYFNNRSYHYIILYLMSLLIIILLSFVFLLVPLYKSFCDSNLLLFLKHVLSLFFNAGILSENEFIDLNYLLKISVYCTVTEDLPWIVTVLNNHSYSNITDPVLKVISIFNNSGISITGIAIVDIMPIELRGFVSKQQCFCFEPLRLYPWSVVYLPIVVEVFSGLVGEFYSFRSIILSYSFFRISW